MPDSSSQSLRVLIFGDIVGKIGRACVRLILPEWKQQYKPDLVTANVENLAHGSGVTEKTLRELAHSGVDVFTGGNHIWAKSDPCSPELAAAFAIATPANDPRTAAKEPWKIVMRGNASVHILNLQGQVFMADEALNPFLHFNALREQMGAPKILLVDFHAEATSEKVALGHYLDGRASLLFGTHTHVPTADARILPGGMGYISDVGMTGSDDSVLGVDKHIIIRRFTGQEKAIFDYPESGAAVANAILADIDLRTGACRAIEHIQKKVIIE